MADPTEVEQSDDHTESSVVKELRVKAKRLDQAEAKTAELERKLALSEAGLTGLTDKQVKALLSAHEGEITAEAIKATADELGFAAKVETAGVEVDSEQAQRDAEVAEVSRFSGAEAPSGGGGMTPADVNAKIASFESPEALKEWVIANPELFSTGAP